MLAIAEAWLAVYHLPPGWQVQLFVYLGRKLFNEPLSPDDRNSEPQHRKAPPLCALLTMTDRLNISIKNLYATFSKYRGNPSMTGSPLYSNLDDWNKSLFSKPLQDLASRDLSIFAGKVISTWGDTNDLKHFLPRLFELTALLDTPYDVSILYQKLEDGNFQAWDIEEQNAINELSLAMWDNLLYDNSETAEWEFDNYFTALSCFYPHFNDLTELWLKNDSFSSIKHLSNYIYNNANSLFQQNPGRGNEKMTTNIIAFKCWLLSESLIQKLTNAFYQFEKTELAEKISWSVKILEAEKHNTQQEVLRQQGTTNKSSS